MSRPLSKKKQAEIDRIKALSNLDLLNDTLVAASPDDYDGCWTSWGSFCYERLSFELYERLMKIGFIPIESMPEEK